MGDVDHNDEIPQWVHDMVNVEFHTSKGIKPDDLAFFCVDCGGKSMTKHEKERNHGGHRVLQTMSCSRNYGYRVGQVMEMNHLLDVTGVCPYKINKSYVFFPRDRLKEGVKQPQSLRSCVVCKASLSSSATSDDRFCSIKCKLDSNASHRHNLCAASWSENVMLLLKKAISPTEKKMKITKKKVKKEKGEKIAKKQLNDGSLRLMLKRNVGIFKVENPEKKLVKNVGTKVENSEKKLAEINMDSKVDKHDKKLIENVSPKVQYPEKKFVENINKPTENPRMEVTSEIFDEEEYDRQKRERVYTPEELEKIAENKRKLRKYLEDSEDEEEEAKPSKKKSRKRVKANYQDQSAIDILGEWNILGRWRYKIDAGTTQV